MKSKLMLRIASVVMFLHDIGHTIGHLTWKETTDPIQREVIKAMTENKFPFMGATRSLGDYYEGYGWASTIALLLIAVILWITSGANPANRVFAKKILITMSIVLLLWEVIELIFVFPFAALFTFVAFVLTTIAIFRLPKEV